MHRQPSQLDKESDVEEQEEDTAAESESDLDGNPARDIKLRPRKRVSFKLDDAPAAGDAFQVGTLQPSLCLQSVVKQSMCYAHYQHAASLQVVSAVINHVCTTASQQPCRPFGCPTLISTAI